MHLCSSYAKFFYFYEEFKNVQANTFPMSQLLISFDFQIKCSPMPHLFLHIFSILASQRLCLKESACLIIQSQVILKIEPNQKKKNFNNIARNLDNISCYIFFLYHPLHPLAGYICNPLVLLYLSLHHLRSTIIHLGHPGVFFIAFHFSFYHQTPFISPGVFIAMFTGRRTEAGWEQDCIYPLMMLKSK